MHNYLLEKRQKQQELKNKDAMKEILEYLKAHGERFDAEIAVATGIPLETVLLHLAQLAARGEIITCHSIRFVKEKKTEGMCCRIAGFTPPAAPGRKSIVQLKLS